MKKIFIPVIILLLGSCNMNDPDLIREQIINKKEKIRELNDQISQLEKKLVQDSSEINSKFLIPVSVKVMEPVSFRHYIDVTGTIQAENDAFISPEINGQINKIHVKEGQRVHKGQLMVTLNTDVTNQMIKEVETGLELAIKLFEKQEELWEQKIGSEIQYLQAKNSKEQAEARLQTLQAQLEMARIKAPFGGIVESIMLREGEMAAPGMQLLQLVSLKKLKLYADLSEKYIGNVRKGDVVIVEFPDLEGLRMNAPIHRVGNIIDERNRTFSIEIKLDNTGEILKPNLYTIVRINDYKTDNALVVPSIVIKQDIRGNYLYVVESASPEFKAKKKYVDPGLSSQGETMIIGGISEGDKVIVDGFSQVSDGVEVNITIPVQANKD